MDNIEQYLVTKFDFEETTGDYVDKKSGAIAKRYGANSVVGQKGNAVSFDGNDYLILDKRIIPVGEKTIRFKIKVSNLSSQQVFYIDHVSTSGYGLAISLGFVTGKIGFHIRNGSGKDENIFYTPAITTGKWYDILFSWDSKISKNNISLFLDGILTSVHSSDVKDVISSEVGVFGRYAGTMYFIGQLDEFEVYNKALTPSDLERKTFYLFKKEDTAYTVENNALKSLGTITTANASTLFKSGVEAITKEHCVLVGQQLGKAKIMRMLV